jgi:hypothetical protein
MLHCPNEDQPWHPAYTRFFAEAIVEVGNDCLVQEFIEFLPTSANCGACMAEAVDDGEY